MGSLIFVLGKQTARMAVCVMKMVVSMPVIAMRLGGYGGPDPNVSAATLRGERAVATVTERRGATAFQTAPFSFLQEALAVERCQCLPPAGPAVCLAACALKRHRAAERAQVTFQDIQREPSPLLPKPSRLCSGLLLIPQAQNIMSSIRS